MERVLLSLDHLGLILERILFDSFWSGYSLCWITLYSIKSRLALVFSIIQKVDLHSPPEPQDESLEVALVSAHCWLSWEERCASFVEKSFVEWIWWLCSFDLL